jgi:hypothetical protein
MHIFYHDFVSDFFSYSLFKQLAEDDSPMVRRSAAKALVVSLVILSIWRVYIKY